MEDKRKEIADSARGFAETGFTIFQVDGKRPKKGLKWRQAPYILPSDVEGFFSDWDGNYGIAPNKNQLIIDVDPRNFNKGDSPIKRLFEQLEVEPKDFTKVVQTGGGGLHLFLHLPDLPEDKKIRKNLPDYKGIDFISLGAYVVGAGSIHPETEEQYKILRDNPIAEAPDKLVDILLTDKVTKKDLPALIDTVDDEQTVSRFTEYLLQAPVAIEGDNGDKTTFFVACKGKEMGLSAEDTLHHMAEIYNPRCAPVWSLEELSIKVGNAYEYSSSPLGALSPQADFAEIPESTKGVRHPDWNGWHYNGTSAEKKSCVANVDNYFINYHEMDSPIHDSLAFNEFTHTMVKIKVMPWEDKNTKIGIGGNPWIDLDTLGLLHFFSQACKFNVGRDMLENTLPTIARRQKFHPIKDYLNSLKWDGVPRLNTWLIDNSGAVDTKTHRAVSKMIFMQAVARVFNPGCKSDTVAVLEGAQGIYKSTLVEVIGGEYYADILIDPDNKDTALAMNGKWIIEMSEMVTFRKKDYESLKRFITLKTDTYRPPYGRYPVDVRRQSIFISTVNPDATGQYLSDPTGNRRFAPINLGDKKMNIETIAAMRDQLFAEAVHRLLVLNEKPYITDHETLLLMKEEQSRRTSIDAYMESVEDYIKEKTPTGLNITHLWIYALGGGRSNVTAVVRRRLVSCLKELGYNPKTVRVKGSPKSLYVSEELMETQDKESYLWLT